MSFLHTIKENSDHSLKLEEPITTHMFLNVCNAAESERAKLFYTKVIYRIYKCHASSMMVKLKNSLRSQE